MKHQLQMIFKSHNFVVGFVIFMTVFLTAILFPVFSSADPLEMVGGLFFKPGTYVSITDTIDSKVYEMNVDTQKNKIAKAATDEELALMLEWFEKAGSTVDVSGLTIGQDNETIVTTWLTNYDSDIRLEGTSAYRKSFSRLFTKIQNVLHSDGYEIAVEDVETEGGLKTVNSIRPRDFARVGEIANVIRFPLGTDNFGRDMVTELIHAIGTSLKIGFIAGSIATAIGLTLGLLSGYVGGMLDNIITFITNMFTVIPSFIILVLISVSISQGGRSVLTTAIVIGITAWPWTCRSVRSQTLTLKNRDHVNLSKLSGYGIVRIIFKDILPYVASYVVMAYILQISSGILSEAQLSMLGLGPSTTEIATLGLMMNWSMQFQAPISGAWWAFIPVVLSIALISFSLNLMNTGLDQVFNPTLRD
jgi:ABC-type dipeptide/oligopeptide/nickel transport system permease subunit